ncbi:Lysocardiolipin acyltransferase 1 [Yarrowia sp. C11]|nr:Lysocardiolipin acyltransferase 1 [Yarrowia sp. E02]KAG5372834.1 Lysocardiolipin acyltransferase 1 [Yarrowia sp. C11]
MKYDSRKYLLYTILVVMFTVGSLMDLWLKVMLLSESPNLMHYKAMLARRWWSWTIFFMGQVVNINLKLHGDKIIAEGNILLISNHLSRYDYIIYALMNHQNFAKSQLAFLSWKHIFPFFTLRKIMPFYRLDENWMFDSAAQLEKELANLINPYCLVLFPEVTVATPQTIRQHRELCRACFAPEFTHLLYPRHSSFADFVLGLNKGQALSYVYDATITYTDSKGKILCHPGDLDTLLTKVHTIHVHIVKEEYRKLPRHRRGIQKWLEHRWVVKDKFIRKAYKQSGSVMDPGKPPAPPKKKELPVSG